MTPHLDLERFEPEAPQLTAPERAHLESCARCRSEHALFAAFLSDTVAVGDPLAQASVLGPLRRRLSQGFLDAGGPGAVWHGESWAQLTDLDGTLHCCFVQEVPVGASVRASQLTDLDVPGVVPWFVRQGRATSRWLAGISLADWLTGPDHLDQQRLLLLLGDVLSTLRQLHVAGLSHGAVRPGRILVSSGHAFLVLTAFEEGTPTEDLGAFAKMCNRLLGWDLEEEPPNPQSLAQRLTNAALAAAHRAAEQGGEELPPGTIADRYVLGEALGRGTTAIVYEATHRVLGSRHCVKVLSLLRPAARQRLLREGRLMALLDHPNLVPISDLIEVGGAPALVMPFVEGGSLRAALNRFRRDEVARDADEILSLFHGVIVGIHQAHRHRVVHRDLKPANILLHRAQDGSVRARVVDFGLAKALDGPLVAHGPATQAGSAMGSAAYAAPEQWADASQVDERADLWALGCLLYELFASTDPFCEESARERLQRSEPPYDPSLLDAEVPTLARRLVQGLLEPQPEDRMPLDEVRSALADLPTSTSAHGPWSQALCNAGL